MTETMFPHASPSTSFWHTTTPLYTPPSTTTFPSRIPITIIGSGLAGALIAYTLLELNVPATDILILEARGAGSGASSRNAGHVRPDAFRGFTSYAALHGPTQALAILASERTTFNNLSTFIAANSIQCDFNPTTTFDINMTPTFSTAQRTAFTAFAAAGGDVSCIKYWEGEEVVREKTGVRGAIDAYEWIAGSSHPGKLVGWLLRNVVSQGVRLETFCPATSIQRLPFQTDSGEEGGKALWQIITPKGSLTTRKIIHATNAYTSLLPPSLAKHITPHRAQAHSIPLPTPTSTILKSTYSIRYSLRHFYSLIQRQSDGTLIWGISRTNPTFSQATREGVINTIDDSHYDEEIFADARTKFLELFPQTREVVGKDTSLSATELSSGDAKGEEGQGVDMTPWTGIIGMTTDSVPFVGAIEGCEGQFVCAGFGGHGMARIWSCAPGLARLVCGGTWKDTGLPDCFQSTGERLAGLNKGERASVW